MKTHARIRPSSRIRADDWRIHIAETLAAIGDDEGSARDFNVAFRLQGDRFSLQFHAMELLTAVNHPTAGDEMFWSEQQEQAESAVSSLHRHLTHAEGIESTTPHRPAAPFQDGGTLYQGHVDSLRSALNGLREQHGLRPIAPGRPSRNR